MGFFNFGKKKQNETCDCGGACNPKANNTTIENKKDDEACAYNSNEGNEKSYCSNIDATSISNAKAELDKGAKIKVLGPGCKKCTALEDATKQALANLNINESIDHVTDFAAIASYGVMSTPALVVDGKVVSYGKALKVNEVEDILKKARA